MNFPKILSRILLFIGTSIIFLLIFPVGYYVLDQESSSPSSNINKEFKGIGAYIINLDRSIERYDYVRDNVQNIGLSVERISAIDGNRLTKEDIDKYVDLKSYKEFMGHLPKSGMIGCNLSHLKAWQSFLDSSYKYAIIFEDDVSFDPAKVKQALEMLTANDKDDWDISILEISHKGTPLTIRTFPNQQKLVLYLTEVTHGGAYILNRKAAEQLVQRALPIKMPIDHFYTRSWEFGLKFTGIENPRLVSQTFGSSDINHTTKRVESPANVPNAKIENSEPIWFHIKRAMFKAQSYVIRFCYNLKQYIEIL